jgi:hypothetical protein
MKLHPARSNEARLKSKKRQPADERQGVKVSDDRIIELMLSKLIDNFRHESHEDDDPDDADERRKRNPIPRMTSAEWRVPAVRLLPREDRRGSC